MNYKIIFALLIGFVMTAIIIAGGHAPSGFFGKTSQPAKNESPAKIKTNVDHEDQFVPLAANEKASPTDQDVLISARRADSAPALADGKWINSEPLSLEKLRGQVVLLDFWTFGCYNCINTLPAIKGFQSKYSDQGLTIVGIETPETPGEKVFDNLVKAVNKRGIKYPVLTDYEGDTWRAYDVDAWPTIIILDREGRIRYTHVGEGQYDMQEKVIRTLLAEKDGPAANASDDLFNGEKVVKSGADWKKSLTAEQFYVLREKGTERAFTGVLADNHEDGDYYCAACHLKLFNSDAKFESGTGWPSFFQPVSEQNVVRVIDTSDGETRTEVVCPRCGSHLGHVFSDGPKPTGLRYCMNSAALKFEKRNSNAGRQGS